ncbi:MAG: 16S rRNA (cytosine(1402)-N(4))-methyltransferase RsmH [Deltaproteobacteria bacterium]|nr:16S rRNA (cytosine(1402)-N(4))-methyltransferase RsmH [Deltaproteobacteria bacterium]
MATTSYHVPVLLEESLEQLDLKPGAVIVDGTLGGAGHAQAILERTAPDGVLIGLDVDPDAIREAGLRLGRFGDRVRLVQASFRRLADVARELELVAVDGVLLDLGVSSHQLDRPERGFRFSPGPESPLDMRMDRAGEGITAAGLLASLSAEELERVFSKYGELPGARRLARAIVEHRKLGPLATAKDLIDLIQGAGIGRGRQHNPATLVFQALRIAVNDELAALEEGLAAAIRILRPGGRLVVLTYHSLEDRIVKQTIRSAAKGCVCPPSFPVCRCGRKPSVRLATRRAVEPTAAEVEGNPRARSARLRAAIRLEAA